MRNRVYELYRRRNVMNGTPEEKLEAIAREVVGGAGKIVLLSTPEGQQARKSLPATESLYERGELAFLTAT